MKKTRFKTAKLNILTTLMSQLIATVVGIVIPRVMIGAFGSAIYGLTTSIAQFLAYISLLEGGIGRVARGEFYRPLTEKNDYEISRVYHAIKHLFSVVGIVFLCYTLALSFLYDDIVHIETVNQGTVSLLVWIISIGTVAKYLWGLPNLTLMNADQKQYIVNTVIMIATILNAILIIVLTRLEINILIIKLVSSFVYILQPVCYAIYVKTHYQIIQVGKNCSQLKQKWTGIGQHIAYFLHSNTDIVLLTLFADIRLVAVYNVYKLVVSSIRKIAGSFTGGMEAVFGELIAKKEKNTLKQAFWKYRHLLSVVTTILFGTTAVLILPFVKLYTEGITDADYLQPGFAVILLLAEAIDCLIHPCSSLPISANKLKQTRWGSYGEALINIGVSLSLMAWNPLLGVALGTLCAAVFKSIFYMLYSAKEILKETVMALMKNFVLSIFIVLLCLLIGLWLAQANLIENALHWIVSGFVAFSSTSVVTFCLYSWMYPNDFPLLIVRLKKMGKSKM